VRPLRRLHLFVARRPPLYWAVVGLLAAAPAVVVGAQIAEARRARDGWLERRTVLVTRHPVAIGDVLADADVEARSWPDALVPAGAVDSLPDPAVAAAPMVAGEPVVTARLGRPARGPVAALVPEGHRGIAVPRGDAPLPVAVGDRVDVVAAFDPAAGDVAAADALVVHVDETVVVVAVDAARVPATAAAVAAGSAVLALSAGR
jgi:Flp pilus assembly protein CpaB